jgi:hypothetical protein
MVNEMVDSKSHGRRVSNMVNTNLLNEKIKSSGLKKDYIAEQIGISRAGFYKKATNGSEFTSGEVTALCKILSINKLTEKESIFFAEEVN